MNSVAFDFTLINVAVQFLAFNKNMLNCLSSFLLFQQQPINPLAPFLKSSLSSPTGGVF